MRIKERNKTTYCNVIKESQVLTIIVTTSQDDSRLYFNNNLNSSFSNLLQLQDLGVSQVKEPYIRSNIRELNRKLYTELSILYT